MAALLAVVTRVIGYRIAGFRHDPLRDGLDRGRLLLDVGICAALFVGFLIALTRLAVRPRTPI